MTTRTAPDVDAVATAADRVLHAVHECQFGPDGDPRALPVTAMCGFRCANRATPLELLDAARCPMCAEQDRCPACGKAPGLE